MPWPELTGLIKESEAPPRWLVRDLFYQDSLICIGGMPGVGKSAFAYSLAVAVASGRRFLDLETTPTRVLYIDEENGPANMPSYFRWAWRGLGEPPLDALAKTLRFGQNAILTYDGPWVDLLLAEVRRFRPGLIVLDTATPACRIRDENDNAEATRAVSLLRMVAAAADNSTSIIILKHARVEKDPTGESADTYRIRGASAWSSAVDGVIFHLAPAGNFRNLRPTYLVPDKTRAFGLRSRLNITPSWTSATAGSFPGIKLVGTFAG